MDNMKKTLTHFNKITVGYVIQNYVTLPNGTTVCQGQEFKAGEVTYENDMGNEVLCMIDTSKEVYCPFEMVHPKEVPGALPFCNPIKDSYEDGKCPDCGKEIPDDVVDGEDCQDCPHVFVMPRDDD
jgi:DNA-directed RNA polymerase subunit RPC12/RpoP